MRRVSVLAVAASLFVMAPAAEAQIFGGQPRSSAQRAQDRQISQVPRCDRTLGTLTIADGDNSAYDALQLQPPHTLLRMVVQRSGCFTIVERGNATMSAIERERALAGAGELQRGSNVGPGQMRAADYVLIAEVASENGNVSGGGFRANVQGQQNQNQQGGQPQVGSLSSMMGGGGLGGMIGGGLGGGLGGGIGGLLSGGSARGGMNSQTGEANTVLSVVSVRTAETLAASQGYAAKRDVTWNLAGATTLGGFAGGGYETTESGRILAQAFINAYAQLVQQLNALGPTLPPPPIVEEPHAYAPPPPSAPAYAPHNPSGPAYGPTPPSGPAYASPPPPAPAPAPAYGGKPGASGSQGPVAVGPGGSPK